MTIMRRKDCFNVFEDGKEERYIHITNPEYIKIEAYLLDHPEALVNEPVPPEPTQAELDAREIASIKARFLVIDESKIRPMTALLLGSGNEVDKIKLEALESEAMKLRSRLGELIKE